jgi:CBS domain-containing protein
MELLAKLKKTARPVYTLTSNHSVDDAVNLMSSQKVSALIVTEKEQPVGIFAERDIFRLYLTNKNVTPSEIKLKRAMTNKLIVAQLSEGIGAAAALMIKSDIRHLPIVEKEKIE